MNILTDYKSKYYYTGAEFYNNLGLKVVILGRDPLDKKSRRFYCKFDDGAIRIIDVTSLKTGKFSYPIIFSYGNNSINKYKTIYKRYEFMLSRCNNINSKDYNRYGAKGIKCLFSNIYEFWFELQKDKNIGLLLSEPYNYEIDRINNNGNYEIGNIRIVTRSQNQRNKCNNYLYNLIDNNSNVIVFTGIKTDCEKWIIENLGVKTSLCNIHVKKRIGAKTGNSVRYEIITGIE